MNAWHKELSRNHNKFTSATQMFDKNFLKSFPLISQRPSDFFCLDVFRIWRGGGVVWGDIYGPTMLSG